MRKVIAVLHIVYIAAVVVTLVSAICWGRLREFFVNPVSWACHTVVSVALIVIGVSIIVAAFLKPSLVLRLQILWWLPQLFNVDVWRFSPDKSQAVFHSLWHMPSGVAYSLRLGREVSPDEYLFVKLNVIALAGIVVAILTAPSRKGRSRSKHPRNANIADEPATLVDN